MKLYIFQLQLVLIFPAMAQPDNPHVFFREEFPGIWERARQYTIETAEAMPETHYGFSPTPEQLTFREHLIHIADNIFRLTGRVILDDETSYQHINFEVSTKQEVIGLLNQAFDFTGKVIKEAGDEILDEEITFGGEKMTKQRIFYLMRDHCTHHRAEVIVYLRLNNTGAPRYRGW